MSHARAFKKHPKILYVTIFYVTNLSVMDASPISFFRALSDETRWRIVHLVRDRALCVCELADILEMPQSSVSSHVQIIRKAGMIESERRGKWTYFRINQKHRQLLSKILLSLPDDLDHESDQAKAKSRLADRENSCCPGPIKLAKIST